VHLCGGGGGIGGGGVLKREKMEGGNLWLYSQRGFFRREQSPAWLRSGLRCPNHQNHGDHILTVHEREGQTPGGAAGRGTGTADPRRRRRRRRAGHPERAGGPLRRIGGDAAGPWEPLLWIGGTRGADWTRQRLSTLTDTTMQNMRGVGITVGKTAPEPHQRSVCPRG